MLYFTRVAVLVVLVGAGSSQLPETYPDVPPKYEYNYGVVDQHTANNYALQESRDGANTAGRYHIALPDGRVQIVTYTADENGFVAQVDFQGEAVYPGPPPYQPAPTPYQPAPPPFQSAPPPFQPAPPPYNPFPFPRYQ
ncbi:cuticle protein 7-like [Procambarus clarkii]|uniref:cuticle protein 7-like n=1 Tax=Procambarus clarkii TaxID=6728 RepID=UPI001E6757CE|nr:cuticle protein 7-like [Procambarus clarkii]